MRDTLLIQADKSMFMSEFGNVIMGANGDEVFCLMTGQAESEQ